MTKKHQYSCTIHLGNLSKAETEMQKEALDKFLKSFYCEEYKLTKVNYDATYCFRAHIDFRHHNYIKLIRFTEALIAFTLYWTMTIHEEILK